MCGPLSRRPKRIDPSIIFFNLWWRLYFLTLPGPPVESAFVYCIAVRWSYFFEVLQKYVGHSRCQVCGMFGHRSRSRINKFQSHAEQFPILHKVMKLFPRVLGSKCLRHLSYPGLSIMKSGCLMVWRVSTNGTRIYAKWIFGPDYTVFGRCPMKPQLLVSLMIQKSAQVHTNRFCSVSVFIVVNTGLHGDIHVLLWLFRTQLLKVSWHSSLVIRVLQGNACRTEVAKRKGSGRLRIFRY